MKFTRRKPPYGHLVAILFGSSEIFVGLVAVLSLGFLRAEGWFTPLGIARWALLRKIAEGDNP
jgi:hypothetical protein